MQHRIYYFAFAAVAAGLMLFGCSEKIINQDASSAQVRISASAALANGFTSYARIRVNGSDMAPMNVALTFDSATNVFAGGLAVPAGLEREFILEALDTLRGEGSIPDREEVIYRAMDTLDLTANTTDTLDFVLFPTVPMLSTSPSIVYVNPLQSFSVDVGMYHPPANLYGLAFRIAYAGSVVVPDSVQFFLPASDSLIMFSQLDRTNSNVVVSISETNTVQTLFGGAAYTHVARVFFHHLTLSNLSAGYLYMQWPDMTDANLQPIYMDNLRTGWTDVYINPPAL